MVGVDSGPSLTSIKNLGDTSQSYRGFNSVNTGKCLYFWAFYLFPGAFETWRLFCAYPEQIASYAGCPFQSPLRFLGKYGLESQSPYFKDFLLLSAPSRQPELSVCGADQKDHSSGKENICVMTWPYCSKNLFRHNRFSYTFVACCLQKQEAIEENNQLSCKILGNIWWGNFDQITNIWRPT